MRKHYDFSKGTRGAVLKAASGKTRITIRLDDDLLAWFRQIVEDAGGGNYQTLINDALREYVEEKRQPLAAVLRDVLREELARYGQATIEAKEARPSASSQRTKPATNRHARDKQGEAAKRSRSSKPGAAGPRR